MDWSTLKDQSIGDALRVIGIRSNQLVLDNRFYNRPPRTYVIKNKNSDRPAPHGEILKFTN